jgi:hypothetical protein
MEKLKLILSELEAEFNIDKQQALKYVIMSLRTISVELDLDFDSALDKSEPSTTFLENGCDHALAFPCNEDSIFCPKCNEFLVKGKMSGFDIKENHWR